MDDPRYEACLTKDARFDGRFIVAVKTTKIYCRPSCPARTAQRKNVTFYATAAAAQRAGYRACLRCRPDVAPGSPDWDARADVAGRAMRLIGDGVVDREGVAGLAARLGYSERHLGRVLVAELGAGPLALARAARAQSARVLIETTDLGFAAIAFAAGFASVRQFNDTIRAVYARTPTELRRRADGERGTGLSLRLAYRSPWDGDALLEFLARRAVPGVEEVVDGVYRRTLRLPHGPGVVELEPADGHVACRLRLADLRDLGSAVQRSRRLLDLDADPVGVATRLSDDPLIGPLVVRRPGLRVPGTVDGPEIAVRAVLGQQVSVAGARTLAGRLVERYGEPLPAPDGGLTHLFPTSAALADAAGDAFAMPVSRGRALRTMCRSLADGTVDLEPGAHPGAAHDALLELPGIGPWTAGYVTMRALADPDAWPIADLGLRRACERLGLPGDPRWLAARAEDWSPFRAYATMHLWSTLADPAVAADRTAA